MRKLRLSDLRRLEEIHDQSFPLPDLSDANFIIQGAIERDGKLVGGVLVKRTTEISLVLDKKLSTFSRARIIYNIFFQLFKDLRSQGYNDTHLFVIPENDDKYIKLLKNKFNFQEAAGKAMYLKVEK